ncbi:sugar phosphate nucleotidyltransferase, partial [Candidatus Pelagibacter sp.]|nr:sugar phosphate nucleotidyltransferase [Candidatus Pelagibacter sp.]
MAKLDIIILCGGLGTRIKSKSKKLPKILINIKKKKPFLLYLLRLINPKNFDKIVLSVGYRKNKLIKFIKENPKLNLKYSIENQ